MSTSAGWRIALGIAAIAAQGTVSALAQLTTSNPPHGAPTQWHPESNKQRPSDIGVRSHTNVIGLMLPEANARPPRTSSPGRLEPLAAPHAGYYYETPSSLACVYGFVTQTTGCNPANATAVISSGAGLAIAIVDAFHNPNVKTDLATFDAQFGLPAPPLFQVVYASGSAPAVDTGWALESSLDVEWAHAMSPNAKLYLVEAASDSNSDLLAAVDKATQLVSAAGGGVVSMSWGGSEFSNEASYDSHFKAANVTYVASTGDAPGTEWPSVSAYVVAVGGTSVSRNPRNGDFIGELAWQQTGSGISQYVARPTYQNSLSLAVGNYRGVPDIAAVADPDTGVWVYSGANGGWWVVGGTSVAAPVEAGIVSYKGLKYSAAQGALNAIYGSMSTFRDITNGNCGPYAGFIAGANWDLCTGRGSLLGGLKTLAAGAIAP